VDPDILLKIGWSLADGRPLAEVVARPPAGRLPLRSWPTASTVQRRRCTICAPDTPELSWVRVWSPGGLMRWCLADDEATRAGITAIPPWWTRKAVEALAQAVEQEHGFAGWLAAVLTSVAAAKGCSDALTAGRPGSWEASLVDQLVKGTVGYDEEYLGEVPAGQGNKRRPRSVTTAVAQRASAHHVNRARRAPSARQSDRNQHDNPPTQRPLRGTRRS